MTPLLDLTAWIFDVFLSFVELLTETSFFLVSRTFRRQAYERWARQSQLKTAGEISGGLLALTTAAALLAVSFVAFKRLV